MSSSDPAEVAQRLRRPYITFNVKGRSLVKPTVDILLNFLTKHVGSYSHQQCPYVRPLFVYSSFYLNRAD